MTVFGQIVDASQVEDLVEAAIRKWIDTYLGEIERQRSLPLRFHARPKTYRVDTDVRKLPEDQLPAVVVVSAGMPEEPDGAEEGRVDGALLIGVAYVARGPNRSDTRRNVRRGAAAIATLLEQQSGELAPLAQLATNPTERYDELVNTADRTLAAGYVTFAVLVPGMRNRWGGPAVPDDPPPTPLPPSSPDDAVHSSTHVTVDQE